MTGLTKWQKWMGVGERSRVTIAGMQPFESPIDGKLIRNSADLTAHNREHDVYQVGDDMQRKKESKRKLETEEKRDTQWM